MSAATLPMPATLSSGLASKRADSASSNATAGAPDVSICIVSWNVRELLRDCLNSVREQAGDVRYEVIVVDNASKDGSVAMVREEFPWVKLDDAGENLGFGRANNRAYQQSSGRYVLLLNPDTVILDRAIERLVKFADEHPDAGAVGGRTLKADLTLERSCCWGSPGVWPLVCKSVGLHLLFRKSKLLNSEAMDWWQRDTVREVDVITGCCLMLRREVYEKTGGFDEQFFMYAEEVDLCWRIKKLGWKLMFCPQSQLIHLVGRSAAKAAANRVYHINLGLLKLFRKHYGDAYARVANALMWMFYATRVPLLQTAACLGVGGERLQKLPAYQQALGHHARLFRRQYQREIDKA